MIPYGRQEIDQSDIDTVVSCLRSDYLTQGPLVEVFEAKVCTSTKSKFATSVTSATSALHLACLAMGVGPNDEVWVSAISFVSSANCARFCGASVDFIDINSTTINIDVDKLERKLRNAKRLPKVIIAVHMGGSSCAMKEIKLLCDQYGIKIIEDASHAIGAYYKKNPVGSCQYSDATVFSFHPVKIITTGEGGVVTSNSYDFDAKLKMLRSHGIEKNISDEQPWLYDQMYLGHNFRLTDIQCALGIAQLEKLKRFVVRRNEIADIYSQLLKEVPISLQVIPKDNLSSYHLMIGQVKDSSKVNRDTLYKHLREKGIGTNIHYRPIYKNTYYQSIARYSPLEGAEKYFKNCISLPLFTTLTDNDVHNVALEVRSCL